MKILFIDLETPNNHNDKICQFSYILENNGKIIDKKNYIINPETHFDSKNMDIHGITLALVRDKPIFSDIWPNINHLFQSSLIVGHNVAFDLSVIAKTLSFYHLDGFQIEYLDTLSKSREIFQLNSYSLDVIAEQCGYNMIHHHDASEDVIAAYEIYNFINENYKWNAEDRKFYDLLNVVNIGYSSKDKSSVITEFQKLKGILIGIFSDSKIYKSELDKLQKWRINNSVFSNDWQFKSIFNSLDNILNTKSISSFVYTNLLNKISFIVDDQNNRYSNETLALVTLKGIIEGISSDGNISISELNSLESWMKANNSLKGIFPFDSIFSAVENVLKDNKISDDEENMLNSLFDRFINPVSSGQKENANEIDFQDKLVCLTGEFQNGSKLQISEKLEKLGAVIAKSVTKKTDILLVGGQGSSAWAYGNYGSKVKKALQLQEKGQKINIIGEDDLNIF